MTADMETSIRAGRRRVARSRGALSGILVMILGAWAALVPFIGPYFNLGYTPSPDDAWNWTAARGWLEVLPGLVAVLGGLLLLVSTSRAATVFGGWLAALAGAWLVIGPPLADAINLDLGQPDPSAGTNTRALTALLFFFAVGAAILFFASVALGRLSVVSLRDMRAAERRAEAEEAERQAAMEAAMAQQERDRERFDEADDAAARREGVAGATADTPADDGAPRAYVGNHNGIGEPTSAEPGPARAQEGMPPAGPPPQYSGYPGAPEQGPEQHPGQQQYPPAPPPRQS